MKKIRSAEDVRRREARIVSEEMPDWHAQAGKRTMNPLRPSIPMPPKYTVLTRTSPVDNYQYKATKPSTGEEWKLEYNDLQNKYHWEKIREKNKK